MIRTAHLSSLGSSDDLQSGSSNWDEELITQSTTIKDLSRSSNIVVVSWLSRCFSRCDQWIAACKFAFHLQQHAHYANEALVRCPQCEEALCASPVKRTDGGVWERGRSLLRSDNGEDGCCSVSHALSLHQFYDDSALYRRLSPTLWPVTVAASKLDVKKIKVPLWRQNVHINKKKGTDGQFS